MAVPNSQIPIDLHVDLHTKFQHGGLIMKTEYFKIKMEDVRDIVRRRGYYFVPAERLFDKHFVGPKLYIVTDDPDFALKHPELADMVIMTVCEFEHIAQAVNEYVGNEDRERHRMLESVSFEEIEHLDLGLLNDTFEVSGLRFDMSEAMKTLTDVQRRRLYMYYFLDYSERKIAMIEGVSYKQIRKSIEQAKEKIKKIFQYRGLKRFFPFPYI